MNRNPRLQHLVPAKQQATRNLNECDPIPAAYQLWMCPSCDSHLKAPHEMYHYKCPCGWNGTRTDLLLANTGKPNYV